MLIVNLPVWMDWQTDSDEFKQYMGRNPKDMPELKEFGRLIVKGIDEQIEWSEVCTHAAEELRKHNKEVKQNVQRRF